MEILILKINIFQKEYQAYNLVSYEKNLYLNKDKLVVEKKYPINMILRYSNKRETEMKLEVLEGEKIPKKGFFTIIMDGNIFYFHC